MRLAIKSARTYMDALCPVRTEVVGESMTRQDQAELVNINNIYAKTQRGEIVLASSVMPEYGEFDQIDSYDTALEKIMAAEDAFMELDSKTRKEYNNDPSVYYEKTMEQLHADYKAEQTKEAYEAAQQKAADKLEAAKKLVKKHGDSE